MNPVVINSPDGVPYLTLRKDNGKVYIQINDYYYLGRPVEFNFDIRAITRLIDVLNTMKV